MAVTFVATSTEDTTAASTSHDFIVPTNSSGDLIVFGTAWSTPTSSAFDVTPPSTNWTEAYDHFITAASNAGGGLWWRLSPAGGESSSVNFQTNQQVGRSVVGATFSGVDQNTPIQDTATLNTGNSNSPLSNNATVINSSSVLLFWQANDDDDFMSADGTLAEIGQAGVATPSNGRHVYMGFEVQDSTGSTSRSITLAANEEWAAGLLIINPVLTNFEITGVTKDEAGSTLGGVDVFSVIDSTAPNFVGFSTSSSDGVYTFSGLSSAEHTVYGFLDGSTNRMDISDPITPTEA